MPTTAALRSPESASYRSCRQLTFGPTPLAESIASTNGLLLPSDVHTLFDRGYVTVTPELRLDVSRRIREDFENGRHYYALRGDRVREPANAGQRPAVDFLRWHNEEAFLG